MKIIVWNGPTDNSNLGCQALGISLIAGILKQFPSAEIWSTVAGSKIKKRKIEIDGSQTIEFFEFGASMSRNPIKAGNFKRDRILLRALGPLARSRIINLTRSADLVVDVSGGDSFTSMYGPARFQSMTVPKQMTLSMGCPLVLAPQTYGPFQGKDKDVAANIIKSSASAWGRDLKAAAYLESIGMEPKWCPDVAFGLPVRGVTDVIGDRPTIGLNVSGLVWLGSPELLASRYKIRLDYKRYMESVSRHLLSMFPKHDLMLISHVQSPDGSYESDPLACLSLKEILNDDRVKVSPRFADCMDAKHTISKCDLMLGTRMHACVAGLSRAVPTIGFAYSLKARPVFETLGVGSMVVDLRDQTHDQAMASFEKSLEGIDDARVSLVESSRKARESVSRFFESISELATSRAMSS